jgi:hypothetical protein
MRLMPSHVGVAKVLELDSAAYQLAGADAAFTRPVLGVMQRAAQAAADRNPCKWVIAAGEKGKTR